MRVYILQYIHIVVGKCAYRYAELLNRRYIVVEIVGIPLFQ
jgi:hypothetical protein